MKLLNSKEKFDIWSKENETDYWANTTSVLVKWVPSKNQWVLVKNSLNKELPGDGHARIALSTYMQMKERYESQKLQ